MLGILEIKEKGCSMISMDTGYTLRVPKGAMEVVGIIVKETEGKVISWEAVNSRMLSVSMNFQEQVEIIQIYALTGTQLQMT